MAVARPSGDGSFVTFCNLGGINKWAFFAGHKFSSCRKQALYRRPMHFARNPDFVTRFCNPPLLFREFSENLGKGQNAA
jgi:hypothetical protein